MFLPCRMYFVTTPFTVFCTRSPSALYTKEAVRLPSGRRCTCTSVYHQYTCFYAFLQATQYYCYIYRRLAPCNVTQVYRYSTLLPVRAGHAFRGALIRIGHGGHCFAPRIGLRSNIIPVCCIDRSGLHRFRNVSVIIRNSSGKGIRLLSLHAF